METPFAYGKIVADRYFTNRVAETERLKNNFLTGTNTILISPRRWGKSSLVHHAAGQVRKYNSGVLFVFLDLFNVRSETQFYHLLAKETLKAFSKKVDEILEQSRRFLGKLIPKITFSSEPGTDFSLSFDREEIKKEPDEILFLAERLAAGRKMRVVVCIDEFQNIGFFEDPLSFQKKLRANWQLQQHVSFCLFGSKRHMMMEVFNSQSMPFYKFGDVLFMEKIKREDWVAFIEEGFRAFGKSINPDECNLIAQLADNHPYYVQQLAQLAWLRTNEKCSKLIIEEAFESLVLQLGMLFHSATDRLSTTQVNFLKALINGEKNLSARHNLEKYQLGTSANIQRIKKALVEKEIIDTIEGRLQILDPLYVWWLKNYYWK
ncbi:MAG TPA: ATP-binding protein [Bacteroidales bacterium]|nr:ATP-binding protein [Bacteroidales bacterium]